jgi:DNA-directed RNA polymerase subunit F
MNFNDAMDRALAQAREIQRQVADATTNAAEQFKPQIEQSLENARELQKTLVKHAADSSELATEQTQHALGYLNDFMRMGAEAMRESAEQSRATALKMVEESRKVVESMTSAFTKRPE